MKRVLLFPVRFLAAGVVLLLDAVMPRRKLPRVSSIQNLTDRQLLFEHYPETDTLVVRSPSCVPEPLKIYNAEE